MRERSVRILQHWKVQLYCIKFLYTLGDRQSIERILSLLSHFNRHMVHKNHIRHTRARACLWCPDHIYSFCFLTAVFSVCLKKTALSVRCIRSTRILSWSPWLILRMVLVIFRQTFLSFRLTKYLRLAPPFYVVVYDRCFDVHFSSTVFITSLIYSF